MPVRRECLLEKSACLKECLSVCFKQVRVSKECLFGKNACMEVDGTAYWMSENGFFAYDGQLKSLPCLVEDAVFDDLNSTARDLVNAGLNNLFGEISWFYCTSASDVVFPVPQEPLVTLAVTVLVPAVNVAFCTVSLK